MQETKGPYCEDRRKLLDLRKRIRETITKFGNERKRLIGRIEDLQKQLEISTMRYPTSWYLPYYGYVQAVKDEPGVGQGPANSSPEKERMSTDIMNGLDGLLSSSEDEDEDEDEEEDLKILI